MMIELMLIHLNLSKWIKTPDAPICEISASSSDKRSCPYSPEEITRMRAFMKKHNWTAYIQLFYNESPRIWVNSWPREFSRESKQGLGPGSAASTLLN
jgi:hypothetical protein